MEKEYKIENYLEKQTELEHNYRNKLIDIISTRLINPLIDYINTKDDINLQTIRGINKEFYNLHVSELDKINREHLEHILALVYDIYYSIDSFREHRLNWEGANSIFTIKIIDDIWLKIEHLLLSIERPFIDLIPTGAEIIDYLLFTEGSGPTNLDSIKRLCYELIIYHAFHITSEIIFYRLIHEATLNGYKEYFVRDK